MKPLMTKSLMCAALLAFGCAPTTTDAPASAIQPSKTVKVAGIQYDGDYAAVDSSCSSEADGYRDLCAIKKMITEAKTRGASLVVTPEGGIGQQYLEADPGIGEVPATSSAWDNDEFIKIISKHALQQKLYVVFHIQTIVGSGASAKKYKTQVAFDPGGKVVGKHHKFELYGGESKSLTPGTDVSVFTTSFGKVGMLICADMYGDFRLHDKLVGKLGAKLIAVSSMWTVAGGWRWQANFAKNWGVHVVGSQAAGPGVGGGVFDPKGNTLDMWDKKGPKLTVASVTLP